MTQLSPNTIVYDQIYAKVTEFLAKNRRNEFSDNKEFTEQYQDLITFLNNNISRSANSV
jgi:hypothetical protein